MKKQKIAKRKAVRLLAKILLVIAVPLALLVVFAILAINTAGENTAVAVSRDEMKTVAYNMATQMDLMAEGDYSSDISYLYKGKFNITLNQKFIDDFAKNTGMELSLFWGDDRYATSIVDSKTYEKVIYATIDPAVYAEVVANGSCFTTVQVNEKDYLGYFEAIANYGEGKEVILFVGKESGAMKSIYTGLLATNSVYLGGLAIVTMLIIGAMILFVVKAIKLSVNEVNQVAGGNLAVQTPKKLLQRGDEVGDIAKAVHLLVEKLRGIVTNIHASSHTLTDFSGDFKNNFAKIETAIVNVNTAVEEIARGANSQATETQNVTEEMVNMGNAIAETTNSLDKLLVSTEEMKKRNDAARDAFVELIALNDQTTDSINHINEQTCITNQSALEIRSAMELISDIASQTNLLSLNASIEAARAGEHGKGFAVVAEEVRKLADQSQESVNKIAQVIENLIENSNASVEIMARITREMQGQSDKMRDAHGDLNNLNGNINEVVAEIDAISGRVDALVGSKDSVLSNLENLAAISEENAASTQETAATMGEVKEVVLICNESTDKLTEIASELEQNMSHFKV